LNSTQLIDDSCMVVEDAVINAYCRLCSHSYMHKNWKPKKINKRIFILKFYFTVAVEKKMILHKSRSGWIWRISISSIWQKFNIHPSLM